MASRKTRQKKRQRALTKQIMRHKKLIKKHTGDKRKKHTIGYWEKEIKVKFASQVKKARKILKKK